jgi:hypothetical protein
MLNFKQYLWKFSICFLDILELILFCGQNLLIAHVNYSITSVGNFKFFGRNPFLSSKYIEIAKRAHIFENITMSYLIFQR